LPRAWRAAEMHEPKDGDFVAYVEALQRESAARLAEQHVQIIDTAAPRGSSTDFFEDKSKAAKPLALDQAIGRYIWRDTDAGLVKALVATVAGAVFLLNWLGNGGAFSFLIAAALLAYALPRVLAAVRSITRAPTNQAAVEQVFGRSRIQTTETKK